MDIPSPAELEKCMRESSVNISGCVGGSQLERTVWIDPVDDQPPATPIQRKIDQSVGDSSDSIIRSSALAGCLSSQSIPASQRTDSEQVTLALFDALEELKESQERSEDGAAVQGPQGQPPATGLIRKSRTVQEYLQLPEQPSVRPPSPSP